MPQLMKTGNEKMKNLNWHYWTQFLPISNQNSQESCQLKTVAQHSRELLRCRLVDQVPCLFSDRSIRVPFGMVSINLIQKLERKKAEVVTEENSSAGAFLALD